MKAEIKLSRNLAKTLALVCMVYAGDNKDNYPNSIDDIIKYDPENKKLYMKIKVRFEYFGKGKKYPSMWGPNRKPDMTKKAEAVAYDKILLEKSDSTVVLFTDGHNEIHKADKLKSLGIIIKKDKKLEKLK